MAVFYIDNCLPPRLVPVLRGLHHQAVHTQRRRKGRAGDDEQLLIAQQHGEILVAANHRDFALLHDAWLRWAPVLVGRSFPAHPGILVIPQAWTPDIAAHELDLFLSQGRTLENHVYL